MHKNIRFTYTAVDELARMPAVLAQQTPELDPASGLVNVMLVPLQDLMTEADPVAVAAIATLRTGMLSAIATRDDLTKSSIESMGAKIAAIDLGKASQASVDALQRDLTALNALLPGTADVQAAIKRLDQAVETAKSSINDGLTGLMSAVSAASYKSKRYTCNETIDDCNHTAIIDGGIALELKKAIPGRVIEVVMLQSKLVPTLFCNAADQFFIWADDKVISSTDHQGTLDLPYSRTLLVGKAGGWDVIMPSVGGGSAPAPSTKTTTETVTLLTLEPNVWTNFPAASGVIADYQIKDSSGNIRTYDFEVRNQAGQLQIQSLSQVLGLVFQYEVESTETSQKVVLSILPASIWTNFPSSGKPIVDYRIEDSIGLDRTTDFEVREQNGQFQIFSLSEITNLQFIYEV